MNHALLLQILDVADYIEAALFISLVIAGAVGFARMAMEGSGGIPDAE